MPLENLAGPESGLPKITDMILTPIKHASITDKDPATVLLQRLAEKTWNFLKDSYHLGISLGEETISDINLLFIRASHIKGLRVWKCPKHEEKRTGIDWEWWIGSDARGWLRYAVQAKKLNVGKRKYTTLNHKAGVTPQVDILDRYSDKHKAIPLYCLYNYVPDKDLDDYWHCCESSGKPEQLGCTVAPLTVLREALQKPKPGEPSRRTFKFIHSNKGVLPWRCLIMCPKIIALYQDGDQTTCYDYFERVTVYRQLPPEIKRLPTSRESESDETIEVQHFPEDKYEVIPKRVLVIELSKHTSNEPTCSFTEPIPPIPVVREF